MEGVKGRANWVPPQEREKKREREEREKEKELVGKFG